MIVYFSASSRNITNDIKVYRQILSRIYALEHVIASDWVEVAVHRAGRFGVDDGHVGWNIRDIVRNAEAGIERAEVVICEASGASAFGVGFEMAMALRNKKPVLCLIREESSEDTYAVGISKSDLLTVKMYNEQNLDRIVEQFLKENTVKNKDLRFNFVMDRQIYNHLRTRSYKTGKTKAEILRELLEKDIKEND